MKKISPTISVVIATYNSGKSLGKCLSAVRTQNYPQDKIDIILGDGSSTDNTKKIAKQYNAKVISISYEKQNAEYNRGVAFNKAKGELVLIIDHDNFLPYPDWLKDMVEPLLEHSEVVAVETCYYHYDVSYSLIDRYFALFGTSEPIPYYLKKADRMSQISKKWVLQGSAKDMGNYYVVQFKKNPRYIPTIGTNGCLMRRKLILENADVRPEYHYPIDVMVDVISKGHNTFAFVKNSIIHKTGEKGFLDFLRRRVQFVDKYHFQDFHKRRYSVFMKGDEISLLIFVFYSITVIKPLFDAFYGYLKIRDIAWFLHPFMCLGTTLLYTGVVVKNKLLKILYE